MGGAVAVPKIVLACLTAANEAGIEERWDVVRFLGEQGYDEASDWVATHRELYWNGRIHGFKLARDAA